MGTDNRVLQVIVRARDEMSRETAKMQASMAKLNGAFANTAARLGELKLAGAAAMAAMYGLGKTMTGYASFEKQLAYINTIARGTTEEMKEMGSALREVAVEMGVDAEAAAKAMYDIYSNIGDSGANIDVLRAAAKAAVAGFVDIGVTGGAITGVMNAMGKSADDLTSILDTQFKTIERGKINYEQLAESSAMFLASAKGAGQTYERAMGGFATVTKSMQNVARSATAMNAFFTRFRDAEFVKVMKEQAGIAVVAEGNYRDYAEVLEELNGKLATMSDYAKSELIKKLVPGEEAQRALLSIMGNFETFRGDVKAVAEESAGAWLEAYEKMDATTAAKMDKLTQRITEMKLTIGEDLAEQSEDFFSVIERGVNLIAQSLLAVTQTIGGTVDVLRAAIQYTKTWPLKGANWKEDRAAAMQTFMGGVGKFEKAGESLIRSGIVPNSFLEGSAKLFWGETWQNETETQEEKEMRRKFEKRQRENVAELKRRAGGKITTTADGESTTLQTEGSGAETAIKNTLQKAAEMKRRYLEQDARNRIKFLEEERDAVKRLGGETLGYDKEIEREKAEVIERQREKMKMFYEGLKGMAETYASTRKAIDDEIARSTMNRYEYERYQAKTAYDEEIKKAGELAGANKAAAERLASIKYMAAIGKTDAAESGALGDVMMLNAGEFEKLRAAAQREADDKIEIWKDNAAARAEVERWLASELDRINQEEKARRFEEMGAYRQYNLAQLQAMAQDYMTNQEEKYRIQAEINERIAADQVEMSDAWRMGMRQAQEEFESSAQTWMRAGREMSVNLKESFSGIFAASFKGEIQTLGDLWENLCARMRDTFFNALADMAAKKMVMMLLGGGEDESSVGEIGAGMSLLGKLFGKNRGVSGAINAIGGTIGFAAEGGIFNGTLRPVAAFANGGIVSRPTLAMVGEGGGPEAVIPLKGGAVPVSFTGAAAGGGKSEHYSITINAVDAASFEEMLATRGAGVISQFVQRYAPGAVADDIRSGGQMRALTRR
ncbi:MAG TPA: phage tail tape measure protein [bacterium]|nr:phage tail tape measure protein [bacterium]